MTHTPPPHVRSWKCGRWLCLSDFHLLNHERHSGRALTFMIHTLEGFFGSTPLPCQPSFIKSIPASVKNTVHLRGQLHVPCSLLLRGICHYGIGTQPPFVFLQNQVCGGSSCDYEYLFLKC